MTNVNKEFRILPSFGDPAVSKIDTQDTAIYVKQVNGVLKLFKRDAYSGIQELIGSGDVDIKLSNGTIIFSETSDPTTNTTNKGNLYVKDVAGISELFYSDDAGAVTQLTSNGTLSIPGSGTNNYLVRWDGTASFKDSSWQLSDAGSLLINSNIVSPTISQDTEIVSTSSQNLTISAQSNSVALSTGGTLILKQSSGTSTLGAVQIRNSSNVSRIELDASGYPRLNDSSGNMRLRVNPTGEIILNGNGNYLWSPILQFVSNIASPTISQATDATASATGDNLTIQAQITSGASSTGGSVVLIPGTGTATNGSVHIRDASSTNRISVDSTDVSIFDNTGTERAFFDVNGLTINSGGGIAFTQSSLTPSIYQIDETGTGNADSLTILAQGNTNVTSGNGGDLRLFSGSSTAGTGGGVILQPGTGGVTNGSVYLRDYLGTSRFIVVNDGNLQAIPSSLFQIIISGVAQVQVQQNSLNFGPAVTSPNFTVQESTTSDDTGETLTISSQSVNAGGTTITGGNVVLRGGNTSGAATNKIGGSVLIRGGAGSTTNGIVRLQDAGSADRITIDSSSNVIINPASYLEVTSDIRWPETTVTPTISQVARTSTSAAETLTITAQDNTNATSGAGGAIVLESGSGNAGNAGAIAIIGGTSTSATGGTVYMAAGAGGGSNGQVQLRDASNTTRVNVNTSGDVSFNCPNTITFQIASSTVAYYDADELRATARYYRWQSTATTPTITQLAETTTTAADDMFIQAQGNTNVTSGDGGDLWLEGGDSTAGTGGDVHIYGGAGSTATGRVRLGGNSITALSIFSTLIQPDVSSIQWSSAVATPQLIQTTDTTGTTGDLMTIHSQDVSSSAGTKTGGGLLIRAGDVTGTGTSNTGGNLTIQAGNGSGATTNTGGDISLLTGTGTDVNGNIELLITAASFQNMERGVFWGNCTTAPTGNPTSGVFVYSDSGALKARGGSGTVTTMAPADPHCPTCGRDFALEWQNDKYGKLSVCMWCITDALNNVGVIEKKEA